MRDLTRIPRICAELERLWSRYPDMRLGQIVANATPTRFHGDPFHVGDDELMGHIRAQLAKDGGE